MRNRLVCFAAIIFSTASPLAAQDVVAPLIKRLESVDPKTATSADCDAQVRQASVVNAMDLFYGSATCFAAKKALEGNFLLTVGQIRSMPDMALMEPATEADKLKAAGLYGVIFFYMGGPGDEDVYRDSGRRDQLLKMIDSWSADYGPQYDPGWSVAKRPDGKAYQNLISQAKAHRRNQLVAIAKAYSDEQYWSLYLQSQEIQKRNRAFTEGTPDEVKFSDLQRQMDARAKQLGINFTGN